MIFLAYTAIVFLALRLLVAMVNLFTWPLLRKGALNGQPMVSVLIPARNEARNIFLLLEDLTRIHYTNLEVLVYDDSSEDETADIVNAYSRKDLRIRLVEGVTLPAGWLGKNHACHRLSLQAKGEYLLFLDADVRVAPGLIEDSLAYLRQENLQLLSLFPVQHTPSFGERITVPLINWVLLSLLPLFLIQRTKQPSVAAANGQFMLIEAEIYRRHLPHEFVRKERVEDISIIKHFKKLGYRCQTLLSNGQVSCRMYQSYGQAIEGFSKNVNAFFGNNWILLILFAFLASFGIFFVLLTMPVWVGIACLIGIAVLRASISLLSKKQVFQDILLMPLQLVSFWLIIIRGGYTYFTKTMTWKGRPVNIP